MIEGLCEGVVTNLGLYDPTMFPPPLLPGHTTSTTSDDSESQREYPRCCGCCCFSVRYSWVAFLVIYSVTDLVLMAYAGAILFAAGAVLPVEYSHPKFHAQLYVTMGFGPVLVGINATIGYLMRRRGTMQIMYSILNSERLRTLADRYMLCLVMFGCVGLPIQIELWSNQTPDGSTAAVAFAATATLVTAVPIVISVILVMTMYHCAAVVVSNRRKWLVAEYSAALHGGILDEGTSFRIIRSYGSVLVLVEQVSDAAGTISGMILALVAGSAIWVFYTALDVILSGEFDSTAEAWTGAQVEIGNCVLILFFLAALLYLPARLTAEVASTSKRLGFIGTSSVNLSANNVASAVGVAVQRSTSIRGSSVVSRAGGRSSGGSDTSTDSDSDSSWPTASRASAPRKRNSDSTNDSGSGLCGCCPAFAHGTVCCGASDEGALGVGGYGGHAQLSGSVTTLPISSPVVPIPSRYDEFQQSAFRLGDAARYPVTGPIARIELDLVSVISGHLEKTAAAKVGNIDISYSLIGRLVTSVLSIGLLTLRFAVGAV